MGLDFRIVFTIQPRTSAGVLLHAGSKQDNYLTVYMEGGKVSTDCVSVSAVLPSCSRGNSDLELWTYVLQCMCIGIMLNNFLRVV